MVVPTVESGPRYTRRQILQKTAQAALLVEAGGLLVFGTGCGEPTYENAGKLLAKVTISKGARLRSQAEAGIGNDGNMLDWDIVASINGQPVEGNSFTVIEPDLVNNGYFNDPNGPHAKEKTEWIKLKGKIKKRFLGEQDQDIYIARDSVNVKEEPVNPPDPEYVKRKLKLESLQKYLYGNLSKGGDISFDQFAYQKGYRVQIVTANENYEPFVGDPQYKDVRVRSFPWSADPTIGGIKIIKTRVADGKEIESYMEYKKQVDFKVVLVNIKSGVEMESYPASQNEDGSWDFSSEEDPKNHKKLIELTVPQNYNPQIITITL